MDQIPVTLYGVPAGALIMAAVAALEQVGLPGRFAGVAAIVIAVILGTIVLVIAGTAPVQALGMAFVWGLAIVSVHASVVKPIKAPPQPDSIQPPTTAG